MERGSEYLMIKQEEKKCPACRMQGKTAESSVELETARSGITVSRRRRPADFMMPQDHYHRYYELYYLVSGRCRVFLDHTIYHMEPGNMILIEPLALHHTIYGLVQESERIAVSFHADYMERMEAQCGAGWRTHPGSAPLCAVEPGRRAYVESLFRKILAEQTNRDEFTDMLSQNYLFELLAFMGRCGRESRQPQMEDVKEATQETEIQNAARYICSHFREPLTLELVAERVHMTPSYFSRRFKKLTGFGYKEYLNYVRLKEASRMLLETDLPVMDIAQLCGFSDGNYFGDLFKKEKGISPRLYRKNPQIL